MKKIKEKYTFSKNKILIYFNIERLHIDIMAAQKHKKTRQVCIKHDGLTIDIFTDNNLFCSLSTEVFERVC